MTAIPILPARNLDRTAIFFHRLGFTQQRRYPDYLVAMRGAYEIHFAGRGDAPILLDPPTGFSACYLRCDDADALYREWLPLQLPRFSPIADQPWGLREFHFVDPDATLFRVGHRLT